MECSPPPSKEIVSQDLEIEKGQIVFKYETGAWTNPYHGNI